MTKAPRSARGGLLLGAGLGVAITIAVAGGGSLTGRRTTPAVEFRPDPAVLRWTGESFAVEGVGRVTDFDMDSTRLYLLDGLNHSVRMLKHEAGTWTVAGEFGSKGAGPGEFVAAHGIAVTPDGAQVVVADDVRLHFFTGDGDYLHSHVVATECRLMRPRVAAGQRGYFVSGNCYRTGSLTDTMLSVLYWTVDGLEYESITSDIRFTRDGRTGSFMSAVSTFSESDSLHLFGTGSTECTAEIIEQAGGSPHVRRRCGVVKRRYSAPAPAAIAASLRAEQARRGNEPLFTWPDPLPAYMDQVVADGTAFLLRPFTGDSLVVEAAGTGVDLLVTGMDGLVACRRRGCMWGTSTVEGTRLQLLEVAEIRSIAARTRMEGR